MRETEIRPDNLLTAQRACVEADSRRLMSHADEFVVVPCPACASPKASVAFCKYGLSYVRCAACETVYVSPRPTPTILEDFYLNSENYAYFNNYIFPASEGARREKIFRPRVARLLEICERHEVGTGTLLEVGAGFGIFCEEVQRSRRFRRVVGVEPTPDLAQTCRNKGIETIQKPIEHVSLDEHADVIASFEVIEHLFSPSEFISQCGKLLAPGGLLVLTCPNIKGFDIQVLQAGSSAVDYEHLNYFHPKSLSHLASACGFDVVEVTTPGKLDAELVRKSALAGEIDLESVPFFKQILLEEWERLAGPFQQFLSDNGLSSHMWLVAKKR